MQVAVKAEAQKGKANIAVCKVMSTLLKTDVEVVSGHTSRQKRISVKGMTSSEIVEKLEGLLES